MRGPRSGASARDPPRAARSSAAAVCIAPPPTMHGDARFPDAGERGAAGAAIDAISAPVPCRTHGFPHFRGRPAGWTPGSIACAPRRCRRRAARDGGGPRSCSPLAPARGRHPIASTRRSSDQPMSETFTAIFVRAGACRRRARTAALTVASLALAAGVAHAADEIHWTFTGPTSVSVDWRGAESVVHYGPTSAYGLDAGAATPDPLPFSSAGPFWEARLTGLLPNTLYHYAIGGAPDHTFRTPLPRGASGFVVCVEGDIGDSTSYPRWLGPVQRLVAQQQPRFALLVGDLTYANDHGQAHVDQHFNDVMAWSLDAAYLPAWGNHEWDQTTDDFRNYKGRFDLPNPRSAVGAPSAGGAGEDWYWFDYGDARFIAYPEPFSGAWSAWSRSADSLMTAVDADPEIRYIVTFGHRPAYSSGHHPGDNTLKGYLDQLGAKHPKYALDLCGHSHNYERTFPQSGVTHITNGEGGATQEIDGSPPCTWLGGCPPPSWSAFRAFHHGALTLRFSAA